MKTDYDIAIIGAGSSGVEAATYMQACGKSVNWIVLSAGDRPSEIPNTRYRRAKVTTVFTMGSYFVLSVGADVVSARCVVLATGRERIPPITGERAFHGRGVSYCAECDGALYRGRTVAVIRDERSYLKELTHLQSLAAVHVFGATGSAGTPIVEEIMGNTAVTSVRVNDGTTLVVDGVFVLKDELALQVLVPGLATTDREGAVVDDSGRTNLAGCFAAGSCAETSNADRLTGRTAASSATLHLRSHADLPG